MKKMQLKEHIVQNSNIEISDQSEAFEQTLSSLVKKQTRGYLKIDDVIFDTLINPCTQTIFCYVIEISSFALPNFHSFQPSNLNNYLKFGGPLKFSVSSVPNTTWTNN